MAACCPGSGQVQTKMRPFFSKPANSMPLSSRGERGSFFFPLPKCILIPLFYILISLKKKKISVTEKKRHSVLQNPAASLAAGEAGWHYPLI
jgi:hypothetical protein